MTTARVPRRAALVGLAFLVALGGWAPGDVAGAMLEGQDRKPAKQRIPVVWGESPRGSRGIPLVVGGTRGPMTASIVRSGSNGSDAAGTSVPPVAGPALLRGVQVYLGGQSEPAAPAPQSLAIETYRVAVAGDYRLGPGDMIDVFVWRNPELSRKVPVRPDGRISLPLVGEMVATGKTPRQVQDEITATLAQYIHVPTVTVTVIEIRSLLVYVLGNVAKPGPLQLNRKVTVLQAISMAGGLNEFADKNDITILRTVDGQQQRIPFRFGDLVKGKGQGPEILLRAGDVVYVP